MTQPPADPLVGTTIAQYEILAKIGGGGMGVVYAARDTKLGRRVALKFLPPQWSHDEGAKQRFIREAQAASATDHPNICTVHDIASTADGRLFIVMAHYEGQTLKQKLEGGPLEIDAAVEIAAQAAEGLAKAHAQGVVHRDIKPGNLMVCGEGVKVLDFGLAKFATALQLTLEHSTLGTAAYMSPEQVKGEEADARSDVWSLGVVLYEMLAGRVPFQGAYAEAIAYAIRNDAPGPLRAIRPDVPEALEQIVFRALHKDPAIRYQSGRELARALRALQGRGIPEDLLTAPVAAMRPPRPLPPAPRRRTRSTWIAAAMLVVVIAAAAWLFSPVERLPVAIVPVINQTGYAELDPYRLALTQELVAQLEDAPSVRVLPYERLLQIIRRFRATGQDVSSREAVQAIAAQSGARMLVIPTLLYEDGGWKARLEFRDPQTAVNADLPYETAPVVSSLMKEAVYGLMPTLASVTTDRFVERGPIRGAIAARIRRLAEQAPPPRARLATLDAAAAFERGLDALEQMEYAAAREAFGSAAQLDARQPLPLAWRSYVAALMRQDKDAGDSADRASRLLAAETPASDRLFVEAVAAESRRDSADAEARYRQLVERHPDEPQRITHLAAFLDRQGRATEAVRTYHEALARDDRLIAPHVELCRLYSPSRLNEAATARQHGEQALKGYQALQHLAGEVQARWCLTDVLRVGTAAERSQARRHADTALEIVQRLDYPYARARAFNYVANVALLADRNGREAAELYEKALEAARAVGNVVVESRVLMNLGAAYETFGRPSAAVKYYRDSFDLFESLGNQQEAAWSQVNAAAILIDYGVDPDQGLRDAQNALAVFQKIGDKDFEVFARRMIAAYYRHAGRSDLAERELTLARSIARERNLTDKSAQVDLDLARLRIAAGDYTAATALLRDLLQRASGTDAVNARIELGRTLLRMKQFEPARAELDGAEADARAQRNTGSLPLLYLARGELAFDNGAPDDAAAHFRRAAQAWTDDLPEPAAVEAAAYLGLVEALGRDAVAGRALVQRSLDQAGRMRRITLQTRCRLFLARIDMTAGRYEAAATVLDGISPEAESALDPALRAELERWRSQVTARRGARKGRRSSRKAKERTRGVGTCPTITEAATAAATAASSGKRAAAG